MTMITRSVSPLQTEPSPEGQRAWALAPSLFGEELALCRNYLSRYACSDLMPVEMKCACTYAGKKRCGSLTFNSVAGALFAVLLVCWSWLLRINSRLVGRGRVVCRHRRFVVVVGAAFVVVVVFSRVRCLSECSWFGCRCRGDGEVQKWMGRRDAYCLARLVAHLSECSLALFFGPCSEV